MLACIGALATVLSGCIRPVDMGNQPQPVPDPIPVIPTAPPVDQGRWVDEREHVRGICFEAGWDAPGRIFIIRSAEDHIRFYDLADNSRLCRRPVSRVPRDFSDGYTIIGLWSKGIGCTAAHDVTRFQRDDDRRTLVINLQFTTDGDCGYELLRPWWVGVAGVADYEITLIIE